MSRQPPASQRRRDASGRGGRGGATARTRSAGTGAPGRGGRPAGGTPARASSGTAKNAKGGAGKRASGSATTGGAARGAKQQGAGRSRTATTSRQPAAAGPRQAGRRGGASASTGRAGTATFRRRRAVVGLLALILVAGLAFGVVQGVPLLLERFGPSGPEPTAGPTEEATGPDEEAMANPVGCLPEAVSLELGLAATEVDAGSRVEVPITITNTGQVPCLLDVGNAALQLEVTSGTDTVWTTAQCPAGTAERPILLPAGGVEETAITWSGHRSAADCPGDTDAARAGTYRIQVRIAVDGGEVTERRTLTLT